MAVDFNAFVRRAGAPSILVYLKAIGLDSSTINSDADPVDIVRALQKLAPDDPRVWRVFENAEQFAQDSARAALRAVLVNERGLMATFDAMTDSNRVCALWLAGARPDLFERAVSALNTWKLVGGQSWDGFRIVSEITEPLRPDLNEDNLRTFEKSARAALHSGKSSLPGGKLIAVPFQRLRSSSTSHGQEALTQITIYSEGPP